LNVLKQQTRLYTAKLPKAGVRQTDRKFWRWMARMDFGCHGRMLQQTRTKIDQYFLYAVSAVRNDTMHICNVIYRSFL